MTSSMEAPIDVLAKVSNMPKSEIRKIAEECAKNAITLGNCKRHNFDTMKDGWWYCSECGGRTSTVSKLWYEKGLEHGNQNRKSD